MPSKYHLVPRHSQMGKLPTTGLLVTLPAKFSVRRLSGQLIMKILFWLWFTRILSSPESAVMCVGFFLKRTVVLFSENQ